MENKAAKEEQKEEKEQIRMMTLSSSFSKNRYMLYSCFRIINSLIISSAALWYSHYYLIRTDDEKSYSYFTTKSKQTSSDQKHITLQNKPSKPRQLCDKITQCSLLFCLLTNIISKLKKHSLTKLLINIKSSHLIKNEKNKKNKNNNKSAIIYLKQSDLQLLNKWKSLLGGNKYYLGSLDVSILIMLYVSLVSETTLNAQSQKIINQHAIMQQTESEDWKNRYFQFEHDTQEIEWANQQQIKSDQPQLGPAIRPVVFSTVCFMSIPSLYFSYNMFPISILCAFNVFKCGFNIEDRKECDSLVWWNKTICIIGIGKNIFMAIINKLHFLRYFAIREVSIATYKKNIIFGNNKKSKKNGIKNKLERRLKNLLSLRSFTYDFVNIFPWICLYVSCKATQSSTYYIKTFASSWFYSALSKPKHEKNRYILKIIAVTTLMIGICVGIGNETYFEKIKYVKRWFLNMDKYSIESYQSTKKAKEILNITPDGSSNNNNNNNNKEEDQIEGNEEQYSLLQQQLINGNYQQDYEMLLSKRYFNQKANDLFEYITEICIFLEDKFLNSFIIPVY